MVELESSSGNGLETPRATQLAKIANRMKISNGLTDTLRKLSRYKTINTNIIFSSKISDHSKAK